MAAQRTEIRPGDASTENGRGLGAGRRQETGQASRPSPPYGFMLVLASIVVIAAIYAVTILSFGPQIRTPATAIAAMTAVFPVITALVGTYFGVKAGLDGQEKTKEMMDRVLSDERFRNRDPR